MITPVRLQTWAALLLGLALAVVPLAAWAGEADQAKQAAEIGLPKWLKAIPKAELSKFGFANEAELGRAALGEPLQIFTMPPDKVLGYAGQAATELIKPTAQWLFPVTVDGQARVTLLVDKVQGGAYEAVSFGAAGLARQIGEVKAGYAGYDLTLVRVYQAKADLILLAKAGEGPRVVALESAQVSLGLKKSDLLAGPQELQSLIPALQAAVKKGLAN
jgi:hypothetical protein